MIDNWQGRSATMSERHIISYGLPQEGEFPARSGTDLIEPSLDEPEETENDEMEGAGDIEDEDESEYMLDELEDIEDQGESEDMQEEVEDIEDQGESEDMQEEDEEDIEDEDESEDMQEEVEDIEDEDESEDMQEEDDKEDIQEDAEEELKELEEISELLDSVQKTLDEVGSIREILNNMTVSVVDREKELQEFREKSREWEEQGYNIGRLETAIATRMPEMAHRVFESFERDVGKLQEIEKSLNTLDTTGFKKREADIRANLKDPETVILTLKHMIELEINIRRRMEMNV